MAAADFPNHNTVLYIPPYHNLPRLGRNATKTQYLDRCTLVNEEEAIITIMKPLDHNVENDKVFIDGMSDNMVVFSFTEKVYNEMLGGTISYISGDVRKAFGWRQAIACPTVQDAANQVLWHVSKGHSRPEDKMYLILVDLNIHSWGSHHSTRAVNNFQRGYRLQMYQLLQGFK